ncbi:MAG TPA: hypothetical protein VN696_12490 [Pyrinomonadaceae bacterium]|nr:hypothetical protein [Pyrinomonadaceae bacterium]
MNRADLKQLAANPDFISGIYNYCDRWCERCPLSSRCLVFATEKEDPDLDDPDVRDLNNAKFWRKLHSIFTDAHELIRECAEEAGVDLEALEMDDAIAEHEAETENAKGHELSVLARNYGGAVENWFITELVAAESLPDDASAQARREATAIDVQAAVEVIRWYQFFIAAKIFRALMGDDDELDGVYPDDSEDEINPAQTDANGSAKIALIAIERSLGAWRIMQSCVPDKTDSIAPLMASLENLRSGIEEALPLARDFIRPGFDEVISEFAS